MKKKNSYIELLRFLMCIVIIIHHSESVADEGTVALFPFGALAADFFFMVTGYFAYAHLVSRENSKNADGLNTMKYWMQYTLGKLKRIFPYAAVGIIGIYALDFFLPGEELSITDRLLGAQYIPFELALSTMLGAMPVDLFSLHNAPLWFLSAMFVALPLLMYLISKYRDVFMNYVIWFLPAILQAWMVVNYGGVCPWAQYSGFIYCGIIRAFANMMMGVGIYVVSRAVEKKMADADITVKFPITILELVLLAISGYEMHRLLGPYDQVVVLYMFAAILVIVFSGSSYTSKISSNVINFLGKLSMPIYCLHWGVFRYMARFYNNTFTYWESVAITFAACVVISIVMMLIIEKLVPVIKSKKQAIG